MPMVGRLWSLADVFGHLVMLWGYVWSLGQLWWGAVDDREGVPVLGGVM